MCGRGVRAGVVAPGVGLGVYLRASAASLPDDWREQVARMPAMRPLSPPPKEG